MMKRRDKAARGNFEFKVELPDPIEIMMTF